MSERPRQCVPFWTAAKVSAALCALFFVVYGTSNYLASLRSDVGTWVYGWEQFIPFVPLMIVPYMSIDLFFAAAPFFCVDEDELKTLARRIALAIAIAGVFFVAMPLRFTFERPVVSGWLGVVFNNFRRMDRPFNQFPSLHIALRTILAAFYAKRLRGIWRVMSEVWFTLIGASTLLVYQHHIADVAGGFALGFVCVYVVSSKSSRLPVAVNVRIGLRYLSGAAASLLAVVMLRGAWLAILWPATALGIQSAAYLGAGPGIFRKSGGRLPPVTMLVLAPILLGQWLSLKYYSRRSRAWDEIMPGLLLGRRLSDREAAAAISRGVEAVLDLTVELPENGIFRLLPRYEQLPILDLTAPTAAQQQHANDFLDAQRAAGRTVYVHCKAGYSRSGAIVAGYLVHAGLAPDAQAAVQIVRERRRGVIFRPEALAAVNALAATPAMGTELSN